jgi:N-acetyl-anhydromuramyl-L-alanine amidase AmpD
MTAPPAPPYVGPAHFMGGTGNKPINRVVVHCTVSPCQPGGARNIAAYFRGTTAGGSAHYVVDPTESVQCVFDSYIAYHAPPNSHSLGVELCDPMTGPDTRWADANHQSMLKRTAVLVAQLCLAYGVPITRLSVSELQAGKRGICGHVDVSQAWKQSTHWDPGPGFPWDQFMTYVRAAAADLQNTTPAPAKDWFDMATQDDLNKAVSAGIRAAIPDIAKAVMASPLENRNPGGTQSVTSLGAIVTHLENQQDATTQTLARVEAAVKAAVEQGK